MGTTAVKTKSNSKFRALDIVYVGMFAALMMIGANITSFIPFMSIGGVPITLQTFFAILAGLFLGSRLGAMTMVVYMLIGLVGAPVFAGFSGGPSVLISPSFGFVVSFIFTAYGVGKIIEQKNTIFMYIVASIIGVCINYLIGTNWMYAAYKLWFDAPQGFTYGMAWIWMAIPFPKDILLAILAGMFGHRMRKIIKGPKK